MKTMISPMNLVRVVSRYVLPEIATADDAVFGPLRFAIEILRQPSGKFCPRVLRKEYAYFEPAYVEPSDRRDDRAVCEVETADDTHEWESLLFDSESEALESALDRINETFFLGAAE